MRILYGLLIVTIFSSCGVQKRYLHSAPPVLNPMLKEKGEGFASVAINTSTGNEEDGSSNSVSSSSFGVAIQSGYALGKHIGLTGSLLYLGEKDVYNGSYSRPFDESKVKYHRSEVTLAADCFFISRDKKNGINLLLGATLGKLKIKDAGKDGSLNYSRYFNSNSLLLFLQPSFNLYSKDNSGLGFSMKINYGNYDKNETDYTATELQTLGLENTSSLYISEAGMKIKAGLKNNPIAIELQLNYIWSHPSYIYVRRVNGSLGVSYNFSQLKKNS